jgi:hypothetical protein
MTVYIFFQIADVVFVRQDSNWNDCLRVERTFMLVKYKESKFGQKIQAVEIVCDTVQAKG